MDVARPAASHSRHNPQLHTPSAHSLSSLAYPPFRYASRSHSLLRCAGRRRCSPLSRPEPLIAIAISLAFRPACTGSLALGPALYCPARLPIIIGTAAHSSLAATPILARALLICQCTVQHGFRQHSRPTFALISASCVLASSGWKHTHRSGSSKWLHLASTFVGHMSHSH